MNKQILREILIDQQQLKVSNDPIPREAQKLVDQCFQNDLIIIITGLRRCGKSTLLWATKNKQKQNSYYFNFDDERLASFKATDFQMLYEVLIEIYGEQDFFYFDEIQNIVGWERFIRRLHDYNKKIIITGSNATMLSQELGTHLTGRYRQIELFPFSFAEFCEFKNYKVDHWHGTLIKATMQRRFQEYLMMGGIPAHLRINDAEYLSDLYEGIIYRDIISRYQITHVSELKSLVYHIASNIAKLINYSKLKQMLAIKHASTVKNYIYYLQQSYLVYLLPKFDYSTKRQELAPKKLYLIDTKLAQTIGFRYTADEGRLLENIIFLQLRRHYKNIFYFQLKKECDFVVRTLQNTWLLFQVTVSLENPETKKREVEGLIEAMKYFDVEQAWLITLDQENEETVLEQGKKYLIHIIPAWKWLLTADIN